MVSLVQVIYLKIVVRQEIELEDPLCPQLLEPDLLTLHKGGTGLLGLDLHLLELCRRILFQLALLGSEVIITHGLELVPVDAQPYIHLLMPRRAALDIIQRGHGVVAVLILLQLEGVGHHKAMEIVVLVEVYQVVQLFLDELGICQVAWGVIIQLIVSVDHIAEDILCLFEVCEILTYRLEAVEVGHLHGAIEVLEVGLIGPHDGKMLLEVVQGLDPLLVGHTILKSLLVSFHVHELCQLNIGSRRRPCVLRIEHSKGEVGVVLGQGEQVPAQPYALSHPRYAGDKGPYTPWGRTPSYI